jgi:hypothetical protein
MPKRAVNEPTTFLKINAFFFFEKRLYAQNKN